jgi:hypothetical protein
LAAADHVVGLSVPRQKAISRKLLILPFGCSNDRIALVNMKKQGLNCMTIGIWVDCAGAKQKNVAIELGSIDNSIKQLL